MLRRDFLSLSPTAQNRNHSSPSYERGQARAPRLFRLQLPPPTPHCVRLNQGPFPHPPCRLELSAEIEVKGMRYSVRWACHQQLNEDGSLTLRSNLHRGL